MNSQTIIEIVGYIGSALVLVSFLMTSVFKLRIVNTIGSFIFMVYALIIHSYPTAIMNFCLVIINLRFLWKMRHTGKAYELVEVGESEQYLQYFLKRQYDDIKACFPGIHISPDISGDHVDKVFLTTCNGAPAGVALGKETAPGTMELVLDYSMPEYRDFSLGQFLMGKLKEEGIKKLTYSGPTEHHMTYLNKMGFTKVDDHYEKVLG